MHRIILTFSTIILVFTSSYVTDVSASKSHQMNGWLTGNYDYGTSPVESPTAPPPPPSHQGNHQQQGHHPQHHQNPHQPLNTQQTHGHQTHHTNGQHNQQSQGHHQQQNQQPPHQQHQQSHAIPPAPIAHTPTDPRSGQVVQIQGHQQQQQQQPASSHQIQQHHVTNLDNPGYQQQTYMQNQQLAGNHQSPQLHPNNYNQNQKHEPVHSKPTKNEPTGGDWLFQPPSPDPPAKSLQEQQRYEDELKTRKTKWDIEDEERKKAEGSLNYKDKIVEITKTHEKRKDLIGEGNRIQNGQQVIIGPNGGYQQIPQNPRAESPSPHVENQFKVPEGYYKDKINQDKNFKFAEVVYGPPPSNAKRNQASKEINRPNDRRNHKPHDRFQPPVQRKSSDAEGYGQGPPSPPRAAGYGRHLLEDPPSEIIYDYGWFDDDRNHACCVHINFVTILAITLIGLFGYSISFYL
ncbi:hypothetical protein Ocin01_02868 [Orchesella cincta]|uniref:Uncharacterized protein n=1 Tax=Orchesella cincta TaxID=48709 RepID=A0A1D2NEX8_ORCCI|nr:hypothetical protein Ocin01_02868 [Orchesella cincta]